MWIVCYFWKFVFSMEENYWFIHVIYHILSFFPENGFWFVGASSWLIVILEQLFYRLLCGIPYGLLFCWEVIGTFVFVCLCRLWIEGKREDLWLDPLQYLDWRHIYCNLCLGNEIMIILTVFNLDVLRCWLLFGKGF